MSCRALLSTAFAALALAAPGAAQPPTGPGSPAADTERAAIEQIGFLVGGWEGSEAIRMGPGAGSHAGRLVDGAEQVFLAGEGVIGGR